MIDLPWWVGGLTVLALTFPAAAAGAAALAVWQANRARDAVGWALFGYVLTSALTTVAALTVTGSWGRDRTMDSDQLFWFSLASALVPAGLFVWAVVHRRSHRSSPQT